MRAPFSADAADHARRLDLDARVGRKRRIALDHGRVGRGRRRPAGGGRCAAGLRRGGGRRVVAGCGAARLLLQLGLRLLLGALPSICGML